MPALLPAVIDRLLDRLDRADADGLESETLEIKRAPADTGKLRDLCVEAAVCLANARGGSLLVDVEDRVRSRARAVTGLPDTPDVQSLKRAVYDATDPHILVEIETVRVPEGVLLLMTVPRGTAFDDLRTGIDPARDGVRSSHGQHDGPAARQ